MISFIHKYAKSTKVIMRYEDGGFISDVLVITANIPLIEGEPGYDADKANELYSAAVNYSKSINDPYDSICFTN